MSINIINKTYSILEKIEEFKGFNEESQIRYELCIQDIYDSISSRSRENQCRGYYTAKALLAQFEEISGTAPLTRPSSFFKSSEVDNVRNLIDELSNWEPEFPDDLHASGKVIRSGKRQLTGTYWNAKQSWWVGIKDNLVNELDLLLQKQIDSGYRLDEASLKNESPSLRDFSRRINLNKTHFQHPIVQKKIDAIISQIANLSR